MKRVFITGGAGFIGQAAAKYFSQKGFDVVIYDIVTPPEKIGTHIPGTIMYVDEMYKAMKGCDYVVHLAAKLGVRQTENNRMECLNINIMGTKNVFDASVYAGVKKIVFSSSSEVYGEPHSSSIVETHPLNPKSVYAASKIVGEEYARAYKQSHDLDYSIIRFFNVYGPGQVAEFVMPRFIRAVEKNESPVVYGEGNQERCFCHVDDAAQGIYLALTNEAASGEIFNIGNNHEPISMKALAERVIKLSNKDIKTRFVSMAESDRTIDREIIQRIPSIGKAQKVLGYNPLIDLDEGITDVMKRGGLKDSWLDEKSGYTSM